MLLYHGTSASRAAIIRQEGFRRFDREAEWTAVASTFGYTVEELTPTLEKRGSHSVSRDEDEFIYFTTGFAHAASYASRAPEAAWDALWSVFLHDKPELLPKWNLSDDGHWWVLRHRLDDLPVVLSVEVSEQHFDAETLRRVQFFQAEHKESDNGSEVKVSESTPIEVVAQTTLDHRVDAQLLKFLTGFTSDELVELSQRGLLSEGLLYRWERYWNWVEVEELLTDERRRALGL